MPICRQNPPLSKLLNESPARPDSSRALVLRHMFLRFRRSRELDRVKLAGWHLYEIATRYPQYLPVMIDGDKGL